MALCFDRTRGDGLQDQLAGARMALHQALVSLVHAGKIEGSRGLVDGLAGGVGQRSRLKGYLFAFPGKDGIPIVDIGKGSTRQCGDAGQSVWIFAIKTEIGSFGIIKNKHEKARAAAELLASERAFAGRHEPQRRYPGTADDGNVFSS